MRSRPTHRPLHTPRTLGVALVCVLAHLFAMAHLFVVPHERCPEHGEMVHGDGGDAGDGAEVVVERAGSLDTSSAIPARPGRGDEDHEHCAWVSERRSHHDAPVSAWTGASAPPSMVTPTADAPPVGRAVHRSAPKTSPPALA